MSAVRLAIAGAGGRMGRALLEAGSSDAGTAIAAALEVAGSPLAGRDAGELATGAKGVAHRLRSRGRARGEPTSSSISPAPPGRWPTWPRAWRPARPS